MRDALKKIDNLKKEIDAHRPFSKNTLEQLKEYYRIGLTYSSNALEGNSLTENETKIVIEDGITIGGKPLKDHYEAIGHSEAYTLLYELAKGKEIKERDVLELHKLFYYHIDSENAGTYRKKKVIITGAEWTPPFPSEIPNLMKEFFLNIPRIKKKYHPVEFSALLHKDLVSIHPFIDGNGRTARLLMNLSLLQSSYAITIIPFVLRNKYINTLKIAQGKPKDDRPFIDFISAMVYEGMKDYIRLLEAL